MKLLNNGVLVHFVIFIAIVQADKYKQSQSYTISQSQSTQIGENVQFTKYYTNGDGNMKNEHSNVDPASLQLEEYKETHKIPGILTTSAGKPVDTIETNTLNTGLLLNPFFIGPIQHVTSENIPSRVVFAKGVGAYGYFEVTNNITKYTKTRLFEKVGKRTRVITRFATSQIEAGGNDLTIIANRGFSVKFYTEEGNLDLLSIALPVYLYRDPLLFSHIVHAFGLNPKTNLNDFTQAIDILVEKPILLHNFLWALSEFGFPRGYRHMNGFPIHTFELYNKEGQSYFVKFKFLSQLGAKTFSLQEARAISSFDPSFFIRDFYNAIETQQYPTWNLKMDVLLENDFSKLNFDPFDVTKLWPNNTYETVAIGNLVITENVQNHFADVDQAAYAPSNLVPGMLLHDRLFQGRVLAYHYAHNHRLGSNTNKILVNCPMYSQTYDRDGTAPVGDNMGGTPNYYPNNFNGPSPILDEARPKRRLELYEREDDSFEAAAKFYNEILVTDAQKQRLVDTLAQSSLRVQVLFTEKLRRLLEKVDYDLGRRYASTLDLMKNKVFLPNYVDEVNETNPDPYCNF